MVWQKEEGKYPFGEMENPRKTKGRRGWGLKNIFMFGQASTTRSLWQLLFTEELWGKIMKHKYFNFLSMEQWIRSKLKSYVLLISGM